MNKKILNIILNVVIVIVFTLVVMFNFILGIGKVSGDSMLPNLKSGQTIIYSKNKEKIHRYDIVLLHLNQTTNKKFYHEDIVKRVVGFEGEHITINNGDIYINNKKIVLNFLQIKTHLSKDFGIVGPNQIFVLGDNQVLSLDSKTFGAINIQNIFGKLIFKF